MSNSARDEVVGRIFGRSRHDARYAPRWSGCCLKMSRIKTRRGVDGDIVRYFSARASGSDDHLSCHRSSKIITLRYRCACGERKDNAKLESVPRVFTDAAELAGDFLLL